MGTSTATGLRGRIDPSPTTLGFVVGDLLLIAVFVVSGELSHNVDPLTQTATVVDTAIPFYVGWLLLFPLVGVYAARTRRSLRSAVVRTAGAWVGAAVVGLVLRGTDLFHGNFDVTFLLVATLVGLALLVPFHLLPFVPRVVRRLRGE
ncbi:DUF3054 domain-containing protein [Halomarina salina]|uniref:DUF3054 domain-containing protein n=1 Tax=Halomarina salina TaxID=1872699 RepID=A0ABD5RHA7_9EURY|nr:DUF3054 domain-containing protein [Halomarina salina]